MSQKKSSKTKRWSARVTKHSNALDLEADVFKSKDPHKIALSLKRSAEHSKRSKAVSIGDVDVELLHQSRRQKSAAETKACSREV